MKSTMIQAVHAAAHQQKVTFGTTTKVIPNKKKIVKPFKWKG